MVRPDHGRGVILSSGSLVLQRVRRRSAGNYTCVASNVEGDTASNPVKLNVMCESRILDAFVTYARYPVQSFRDITHFSACSQADVREPHADGAGDRARPERAHRLPRRGPPEADQVRLVL